MMQVQAVVFLGGMRGLLTTGCESKKRFSSLARQL